MLRRFRHRLFLLLQAGVLLSAAAALAIWPRAWAPIALCAAGSMLATILCERLASQYLKHTLGRLRRAADRIGQPGRPGPALAAEPGDDFYKLVSAINLASRELAQARKQEKRLQERLRRSERAAFLGELAATVAHEINNPLDGVQSCARVLRRSLDDPARAGQMLELMDSGLARIELIVRRLLTLARENVIRPVETPLRAVIDAAVARSAEQLSAAGVEVRVETAGEPGPGSVLAEAALLEQVFINLIVNAADSMAGGGVVEITLAREPAPPGWTGAAPGMEVARVDVADQGAGIAPDVLPHIFEPVFTTKEGGKGTGLGLALAARIVDAHRGTIEVAARPDGGTVFTVRLPAVARLAVEAR